MKMRSRLAAIAIAATAVLALGSIALAAIPDGSVVHGCYDKNSGQLRVTDTQTNLPKSCTVKEAALDWSLVGRKAFPGLRAQRDLPELPGPIRPRTRSSAASARALGTRQPPWVPRARSGRFS